MDQTRNRNRIRFLAQFGILLALEAIVCFTPLGSLPAIGPVVATLMMLPVVVTAILLGVGAGTLMGFIAGLFSFLVWTFAPPGIVAFVFTPFYTLGDISGNLWSLVICFVPRTLTGTVTALCHQGLTKALGQGNREIISYGLSGVLGSLFHTFGVTGGIFLFFGPAYAQALGSQVTGAYDLLVGIIGITVLTSGIPEAVLAGLVAYLVCRPIRKYLLRG